MGSEETRSRILEAAIEVFAREGFAGAPVAEIAEKAEANVALIYRYFGSKEGLLQAVLDHFVQAAQPQREQLLPQQALPSTPEEFRALARWGWAYMQQHRDLLKIVLFESLQDHGHGDMLFRLFDTVLMSRLPPELAARRDDEALQLGLAAFFFGLTPFLMAIVVGKQWAAYYGLESERWPEHFLAVFDALYARHVIEWLGGEPPAENARRKK